MRRKVLRRIAPTLFGAAVIGGTAFCTAAGRIPETPVQLTAEVHLDTTALTPLAPVAIPQAPPPLSTAPVVQNPEPRDILRYSVEVKSPYGSGSGTVIGHTTSVIAGKTVTYSLILTCDHVMNGDFEKPESAVGLVLKPGEEPIAATVVQHDAGLDLAVLQVRADWPVAPISWDDVAPGEPEIIAGSPLAEGIVLSQGFFGQKHPMLGKETGENHTVQQGSAAIWPGDSGGGVWVFRDGWKLAGVAEAGRMYPARGPEGIVVGALADTVSMFVPMSVLQTFLRQSGYVS